MDPIRLYDDGMAVTFTWEQVFAYLGYRNIIASALMTRLFARAFSDLSPHGSVDRNDISLLTAFPGSGVLEAIELITRIPTRHPDRLVIDETAGPSEAPQALNGRLYFEVAVDGVRRAYWPTEDLFDDTFRDQVRRYQEGGGTEAEQRRYRTFKQEKAHAVLRCPAETIFQTCLISG